MLGVAYTPPGQVVVTEYWYLRKALLRYMMQLDPFGEKPYCAARRRCQSRAGEGPRAKAHLVRVARDGRDARDAEVERDGGEARALEEGDEEGAEAAVDVQAHARVLDGEVRQRGDVVDCAVGEVRRRADEEDRVGVDGAADFGDLHLARLAVDRDWARKRVSLCFSRECSATHYGGS